MNMKHWRRLHINGWTAAVSLRQDGLYYHRTHESHIIPADFKEAKTELATAQTFADDRFRVTRANVPVGRSGRVRPPSNRNSSLMFVRLRRMARGVRPWPASS
jgi:hypothetical protein